MKSVAIIGAGIFGRFVAKELKDKVDDVIVIDSNKENIENIKEEIHNVVEADITKKQTFEQLDIQSFDTAIICLEDQIETSILITLFLSELGIKEIVARALSEEHSKVLLKVGADHIIFTEKDSAKRLAYSISEFNVINSIKVSEDISIMEIVAPKKWEGKSIKELDIRKNYHVQVLIIKQTIPEKEIFATPDFVIKISDILVLFGKNEDLKNIKSLE